MWLQPQSCLARWMLEWNLALAQAGELRSVPWFPPQRHLFRATGIFLGLSRPPCMTSWPCRVARRLRRPVPSRPPPARFERRPAGRGGGGGRSRLSWSLPEVRCCRSPCWWSAAAGAAGRCTHKWQGDSRLSSAWSSGQNWKREKHIWGIFAPPPTHALPGLLEGRLTCLDRTQTENTQMYFFFFFLSRFRRIHVNWIKLCRRKNISLFFWNSIYSDRVAFFYLQPWQSLERLSGSGNPFGPDPKLLVLQTINFYPSGFFPSFQMSEWPFFFFFLIYLERGAAVFVSLSCWGSTWEWSTPWLDVLWRFCRSVSTWSCSSMSNLLRAVKKRG